MIKDMTYLNKTDKRWLALMSASFSSGLPLAVGSKFAEVT